MANSRNVKRNARVPSIWRIRLNWRLSVHIMAYGEGDLSMIYKQIV